MRWLGIALRVAFVVVTAPVAFGALSATCTLERDPSTLSGRGATLFGWASAHLDAPFDGYGPTDDFVGAFDVILLSNLAMGLHQSARLDPSRETESTRLLRRVVDRVISPDVSPTHRALASMALDDHNLYFTHALLVLSLARAHGDDRHDALARRLAIHLARRTTSDPTFHAPSYPGSARWPADESATLAALHAYDVVYREHRGDAATRGWLAWMAAHRTASGLPWSATGGLSYARISRGCALSYMAFYTAQFAPEESDALYRAYVREHRIAQLGVSGFREWPPGVDRGGDVDAGLVLFGWGMAATGIGLGAARIHGDRGQVVGIERIADLVGVPVGDHYALAPTLGMAMLFAGETATPWFDGAPVPTAPSSAPGLPILPALLSLFWIALDAWLLRGAWRLRAGAKLSGGSAPPSSAG